MAAIWASADYKELAVYSMATRDPDRINACLNFYHTGRRGTSLHAIFIDICQNTFGIIRV
jgi:hypothetical protein